MNDKTGGPAFLVWKAIPGLDHIEVSSDGQIRTWIDRRRSNPVLHAPRALTASFDYKGYRIICLRDENGVKKTYRVCRLILRAFIGEASKGMQACHGNNIKIDDRIENLRWGTASDNTKDQVKHGVHRGLKSNGEAHPLCTLTLDQVVRIKSMLSDGHGSKAIADCFGIPRTTVSNIKHGRAWKMADAMLAERAK